MELKIENLKVGDELVCIDRESFNSKNTQHKKIKKFVISSIVGGGIHINGWNWIILKDELKYLKKKEQSQQYTFDDLIDVAKKAVRDGAVFNLIFATEMSGGDLLKLNLIGGKERFFNADCLQEGIDFIQSLYKETFVIECEEDMKRIKDDALITLQNGEILDYKDAIGLESYINSFILKLLKGATVTQSK